MQYSSVKTNIFLWKLDDYLFPTLLFIDCHSLRLVYYDGFANMQWHVCNGTTPFLTYICICNNSNACPIQFIKLLVLLRNSALRKVNNHVGRNWLYF